MDHAITVGDVLTFVAGYVAVVIIVLVVGLFGYLQFWWGHKS